MTKHTVIRATFGLALFATLGISTVACGPRAGAGGTRTAPTMGTVAPTGGPTTGTGTGTGTGTTNPGTTNPGTEVGGSNPGTAVAPPPG